MFVTFLVLILPLYVLSKVCLQHSETRLIPLQCHLVSYQRSNGNFTHSVLFLLCRFIQHTRIKAILWLNSKRNAFLHINWTVRYVAQASSNLFQPVWTDWSRFKPVQTGLNQSVGTCFIGQRFRPVQTGSNQSQLVSISFKQSVGTCLS